MPSYRYLAKDNKGNIVKSELVTENSQSALEILKKQGLTVLELNLTKKITLRSPLRLKRVGLFEKMTFTKQLSVMVKAGLPIVESLEIQANQTTNSYFSEVLNNVIGAVKSGESLSKALSSHKKVFGEVYIAMIAAGEKSGQLDKVLERLGESLATEHELIGKIKGAFYYPIFILVVLIGISIFILIFVIPQLKSIFEENNARLPFLTSALIAISNFMVKFFWLIPIIVIILVLGIRLIFKLPQAQNLLDRVKLKLPIFGKFFQKVNLERFARTLSSLISAGVPILDAITTTEQVVNNIIYKEELRTIKTLIERGQPISQAMRQQPHFPPVVSNILSIGEKTGNIGPVADDLADFYSKEIDQTAKNLTSLLEPAIMLIMGVGIGLVVAAVVMPIYRLIGVAE